MRLKNKLAITLFIFLSGCITQANQHKQADKIVQELHQSMQQHDYNRAAKLFDDKFFKQQSQQAWQENIENIEASLGKIIAFNTITKQKDPRFGGDFYIFIFSIQHEHGLSHETITVFKSLDDKPLSIIGYKITARRTS